MTKQLIISVTRQDIRAGKRRSVCECPIAQSLKRRYPHDEIEIDFSDIRIGQRAIPITGKMELWMEAFDNGRTVKPTTFFVDAAV